MERGKKEPVILLSIRSQSINPLSILSEQVIFPPKCHWLLIFLHDTPGIYCVSPKRTKLQCLASCLNDAHSLRVNIAICACYCSSLVCADNKHFCRGNISPKTRLGLQTDNLYSRCVMTLFSRKVKVQGIKA